MRRKAPLFFILFLFIILTGCTQPEDYTDYSAYLTTARPDATAIPFGDGGAQGGIASHALPSEVPGTARPIASDGQDFADVITVVSTPQPTPPPTPVPTGTPLPTLPPSPTPAQNLVRITKSPTSETVEEGGSAMFIANADNSTGIVWITVSPDAKTSYEIGDAPRHFSSLNVSGQGTSVLTLSGIPYEMNGWRIQAYFTGNGGPLYTSGAYLTVNRTGGTWAPAAPEGAESYIAALAQQACSDITYYASSRGFTVGSMENYTYTSPYADFNITVANGRWRITGEFRAYCYSASNYGYGPVHAVVYDSAGNQWQSEHLSDKNMSYYYAILDTYR